MKFLVADDHPLVRRALALSLEHIRPDATLLEAESAAQARAHAAGHPDIDLVLLDLSMPDSEGLDGLRQLKAMMPTTPVAVVSADESAETALRALASGAAGYLPKSLPEDVLRAAISLILAGGMYVPSLVADAAGASGPAPSPAPRRSTATPSTGSAGGRGAPGLGALTQRQREVLDLVIEGLSNKEIAERLDLAEATVKVHMTAILRAYGVNNRTKAISAAQRERDRERALAPAS
ncbi:response regulator [Novispirillum sp. DQ9]|uniref:response regulator n=1 Tax=Novispirillum sp. DQ9 TaxID=3398612 RepID=UPI003C79FB8A